MILQPNILFISCDQLRYDCVGYAHRYPVQTPNIDRLSQEGAWFDHSYTPLPTCCPARQALVCGKRPERIGALWNYDQQIPVGSIDRDEFSWARALHDHGYHTGYVGKWHVSPKWTPLDFGYEDYIDQGQVAGWESRQHPELSYKEGFYGEPSPFPLEDAPTHQNAKHVIELIDRYHDKPWHIKMDLSEPHLPCRPAEPFASMYDHVPKWTTFDDPLENKPYMQKQMQRNWNTDKLTWEQCERTVRLYYGQISQVDDAVGQVIRHLEKRKQLDQTVIIFTADHGDMCLSRRMMDKHYILYDDVVRVPLVIRYPKTIRPGLKIDALVTNMLDLVPTILDFAGIEKPDLPDAVSLMPYLTGERTDSIRKYALSTYNGQQFGLYTQRMIRNHHYKYIWNLADVDELYDMQSDPDELHNLAQDPSQAERIRLMRLDMKKELEAVDDYTMQTEWLKETLLHNRKV